MTEINVPTIIYNKAKKAAWNDPIISLSMNEVKSLLPCLKEFIQQHEQYHAIDNFPVLDNNFPRLDDTCEIMLYEEGKPRNEGIFIVIIGMRKDDGNFIDIILKYTPKLIKFNKDGYPMN